MSMFAVNDLFQATYLKTDKTFVLEFDSLKTLAKKIFTVDDTFEFVINLVTDILEDEIVW